MQVNERQTPNFCKKSKKRYEMFITNKQFYLSPLVFVCPETGNPPPMGRPKQTTPPPPPPPKLCSAIALRQN